MKKGDYRQFIRIKGANEHNLKNVSLNYLEAKELIKKEVGIIFSRVLEDAGVFKRNEKGQEGFNKFLNKVI